MSSAGASLSPPLLAEDPAKGSSGDAGGVRHGSTRAAMRGRSWGPLRREWMKLLFQRRSYLIWVGAAAIPFLIALAIHLSNDHSGGGPVFIDRVLGNGMYVPLAALTVLIPFMLPMAAAMVGGYMIAGEAELGTLRIVLLRPVRRESVLLAKWLAALFYLAFGAALMLASGLIFGAAFFGLHPMVTLSGTTVGVAHGLGLTLLVYLFGLAAMACLVSLAVLFSTLTDSSLTALIATIVVYIVIQVLISFSYFDWLAPYVFPTYFGDFINLFRDPIAWRPMGKAMLVFALWSAGLTVAAGLVFRRKDVLS